jgi:hypothetical protein
MRQPVLALGFLRGHLALARDAKTRDGQFFPSQSRSTLSKLRATTRSTERFRSKQRPFADKPRSDRQSRGVSARFSRARRGRATPAALNLYFSIAVLRLSRKPVTGWD